MDISNPWSCCFFFLKYIFMDSFQLFKIFDAKNLYLWSLGWCHRRIFWCISVSFSGNWDWVRHLSNMGTQSWKSRKWFQVTDFSVFNRWFLINDWQSSDSLESENPRKLVWQARTKNISSVSSTRWWKPCEIKSNATKERPLIFMSDRQNDLDSALNWIFD